MLFLTNFNGAAPSFGWPAWLWVQAGCAAQRMQAHRNTQREMFDILIISLPFE